jgi:hypothetical protein
LLAPTADSCHNNTNSPSRRRFLSFLASPALYLLFFLIYALRYIHPSILGKRARSASSASSSATAPEATRPVKRLACANKAAAPLAKRCSSSVKNCYRFPYSINLACCPPISLPPQKRRACSVDPPTPQRLRSSSLHTLKRRRARSLDRSPPRLRLTRKNLRSFKHSTQSSLISISWNPSPTRKDNAITDKKQLAGYNITVDKEIALPEAVHAFSLVSRQKTLWLTC